MKTTVILMVMILGTNVAMAANHSQENFKRAKSILQLGHFVGTDDSGDKCSVDLSFKTKPSGGEIFSAVLSYKAYNGKIETSEIELDPSIDNLHLETDADDEYKDYYFIKSKRVKDPTDDEYEINIIDGIRQVFENNVMFDISFDHYEINEHSDPHENTFRCRVSK
ncbi:MAG: hypothetical protein K2Q18_03445 [Bdellovibrionales bacterium]|nr:hypothetical protein [Bdellovibrionales bacterium]